MIFEYDETISSNDEKAMSAGERHYTEHKLVLNDWNLLRDDSNCAKEIQTAPSRMTGGPTFEITLLPTETPSLRITFSDTSQILVMKVSIFVNNRKRWESSYTRSIPLTLNFTRHNMTAVDEFALLDDTKDCQPNSETPAALTIVTKFVIINTSGYHSEADKDSIVELFSSQLQLE